MPYPTVTFDDARAVTAERLAGRPDRPLESARLSQSKGSTLDPTIHESLESTDWLSGRSAGKGREECEGELALALYDILEGVPVRILDDPAFWRYVAVGPLWPFVYWREQKTFDAGDPGKYLKYVDGRNVTECVPTRMFLRGAICARAGEPELAHAVVKATDFWRSHVLRVSTGEAPHVTAAFARMQRDHRLSTERLRRFAKLLNRTSTNVVLALYDPGDADRLISSLRQRFDSEEQTA